MSHFTKIKTKINDQIILIKTLDNLKINWYKNKTLINQFNNEKYLCEILTKQKNIQEIGLKKKLDHYELIYDQAFWSSSFPISLFYEKIINCYALNLINKKLKENRFEIKNLTKQKNFDNIKINVLYYY
uniref:Ycf35 n=1 Tax=Merotricha bacillata TaxID=658122 RepID=UPI002113C1B9|nr:Ycf35 [Merotricha bacillata]UTE94512.1 Ycf35 [Merotricha bacillata]